MTSLGCFKDRQRLIEALLNSKYEHEIDLGKNNGRRYFLFRRHNTEKVIYFLLLDRKLRQPTHEDSEDTKQRSRSGSRKQIKKAFLLNEIRLFSGFSTKTCRPSTFQWYQR